MRIIFIEGLPGSGKSTFSRRLAKDLQEKGVDLVSYQEGDFHPIDMAWMAVFNQETLNQTIHKYPSLKKQINHHIVYEDKMILLPFLKVKLDDESKDFYQYCERFEIYRENDIQDFLSLHKKRMSYFLEQAEDKTYIFECITLQNHVNELMINQGFDYQDILSYFKDFFSPFKDKLIKLYYIKQMNVDKTMREMSNERLSDDLDVRKHWIDYVIEFVEKDILKRYKGYDGVIQYAKERQETELKLLEDLSIESLVLELHDDYEQVYSKILADSTKFCDK